MVGFHQIISMRRVHDLTCGQALEFLRVAYLGRSRGRFNIFPSARDVSSGVR